MYGYAARYAPSTVIEARINALVVCYLICRQTCFSLSYVDLTNLLNVNLSAFVTK
jgi:hypothetical protein